MDECATLDRPKQPSCWSQSPFGSSHDLDRGDLADQSPHPRNVTIAFRLESRFGPVEVAEAYAAGKATVTIAFRLESRFGRCCCDCCIRHGALWSQSPFGSSHDLDVVTPAPPVVVVPGSQSPFGSSHDLDTYNFEVIDESQLDVTIAFRLESRFGPQGMYKGHRWDSIGSHNRLSARVTIWTFLSTHSLFWEHEMSQSPFGSSHDLDRSSARHCAFDHRHNRLSARVTIWTLCRASGSFQRGLASQSPFGSSHDLDYPVAVYCLPAFCQQVQIRTKAERRL